MGEFTIKYWAAWAYGIAGTTLISTFVLVVKRYKALALGMQALLRAEIKNTYNKYVELRYMPVYEREILENSVTQYYNLKGNGVVKDLVKKLYALPTEK